ncbi:pyruvate formate-lyase-activating protein [Rhodopirellula sallentina]|uniref:Pyruvate formate-lyase 1-activating enzyme n=1 Tax=Rhodopirellula sallentina SM41 TaxID=1263870 RepID=M5TUP5_9BACT|nr:pyruvate formate-lyase-activating protein [Rhodopirellula sallentina]EMI52759.1 Pyruvate formate-lyase activating [Rhodopirellula sallentina SM41]
MDDRIPSLAHHDCNSGASLNDCCPRDPSIGCERDRDSNAVPQSRVAEHRHDVAPTQSREASPADVQPEPVQGFIHSVETCGTVDGPGLRYVMFLSGCPLRCQYCHNPDAQGKPHGEVRTADSVIEEVLRYRNFIRRGGLTISGGEPMMQIEFVHEVFRRAKAEGIHTALDTSGFLGHRASDEMLDCMDLVLLDIKGSAPQIYRETTGVSLQPTLDFARRLSDLGKSMWIRFVLVPGLTDDESNVRGVAQLVAGLNAVERVEILPFHKLGESKYEQLGMRYQLHQTPEPTDEQVARCREIFALEGVTTH